MELLYFLLLGALAGWLAGKVMKGGGFGAFGNIVLGVVGGVIGGWVFGLLGFQNDGSLVGSLVTAFVGAVLLLFALGMRKKPR